MIYFLGLEVRIMEKVLWIFDHYAVSPDMAGLTIQFDLGKQLVKKGHDVTIFASGFDHRTRKYVKINPSERMKVEMYAGVRFVWINTFPYMANDWRRALNMVSYSCRVLRSTDKLPKPVAIIGCSVHPLAALAGWWVAQRYRASFFFEERDLWPQVMIDMGKLKANSIIAKALYSLEHFLYSRAAGVIVSMPYGKDYVIGKGVAPEKVFWLPNGVDLERFDNPAPIDTTSEISLCFERFRDKFKVVYVGAHGPANGLEVLVEAAYLLSASNQEIHFFLVGDGVEKEKLVRMAEEKGLSNISFLPAVPKSQVPSVLAQADLVVHVLRKVETLRYGLSSNKINEYMASSKPIVTAIEASNNPVVEARCGIAVEPENPEALAKAIIEIYEMPEEKRKELGLNGRRYVEKYHDIRILADQLETILGWKTDTRSFVSDEAKEAALG